MFVFSKYSTMNTLAFFLNKQDILSLLCTHTPVPRTLKSRCEGSVALGKASKTGCEQRLATWVTPEVKSTGPVCLADSNGTNLPERVSWGRRRLSHTAPLRVVAVSPDRGHPQTPAGQGGALVPRPGQSSAGAGGAGANEAFPTGSVLGGSSAFFVTRAHLSNSR